MNTYTPSIDPTGLLMSEKRDGVWTCFTADGWISRTGKPLRATVLQLPAVGTIGELHCGRGGFSRTLSALQTGAEVEFYAHGSDAVVCTGPEHLEAFYASVLALGGEGVVIGGYKLKPDSTDECTVVRVELNDQWWLKALVCEWHGVEIRLGSGFTAEQKACPDFTPGQLITFRHNGTTPKGQPRHASFVCVRDYE